MGEEHRPTGVHSGQPVGWSWWVQNQVPHCGQLQAAIQVNGLLTQLDVDSLGCSLPVAGHTAPLCSGTIQVNNVAELMGMDYDAAL